jgi:hypothetical protein
MTPFLRSVLLGLTFTLALGGSGYSQGAPVVGAIRWDGWHSDADSVGKAVAKSLGPPEFHYRIPFFGVVDGEGQVAVNGDRAEVVEREIAYAKTAHLDYWAFISYPEGNIMNRGLELYLASPRRADVHFCIISEATQWRPDNVEAIAARYAKLMTEPGYQTTSKGRPLFYFLNHAADSLKQLWGGDAGFRRAADALRQAAHERGLADPYLAVMTWDVKGAKALAEAAGLDAISAYAFQGGDRAAQYERLAFVVERFWDEQRRTGAKVIPLAMTGWDRRPRVMNPVPWEHFNAPKDNYYEPPAPALIAQHIAHAVAWCRAHPDAAEAQAVIVYAWNEHDEGGWVCPTLNPDGSPDASRVEALGAALGLGDLDKN